MTIVAGENMIMSERRLTWIVSFSHFITHSFMTLLPAVLGTIAGEYSMSFMDICIIANVGYFLYGFGAFPAGYIADTLGAKRLLTLGVLMMSVSSILVGLSTNTLFFAIAYGLLGISASIHHPAGLSLLAQHVTLKGKALGLHGVLGNIGLFFTPLAAALSVMLFDTWRAAYIAYGLLGFCFFLILYCSRMDQEQDLSLKWLLSRAREKKAVSESVSDRSKTETVIPIALLFLYLGCVFSGFIFRGSLTFFPALFQREVHFVSSYDAPVVVAGFLTTAVLSLGLIGSWFGGYINDKVKRPEMVPVVIFLIAAPVLYLISRCTDFWLLGASGLFTLVYYAWQPSQNFLIAKYTSKSSHGRGFGINFFLIFGVGSIATTFGGYVTDNFGVDRFYLIIAFVACASLLTSLAVLLLRYYHIRFSWKLVKSED